MYLATHRLCLQLADKFIESTKSSLALAGVPSDSIISIRNLWEVLYRRLPAGLFGDRTLVLLEPHDYFGAKAARNLAWEPSDDDKEAEVS